MFNVDKRILYIIIAIFAVSTIVQYIQNPMELLALLLTLPGVIVAITFHEFAHAFVADKLGDDTPRRQGRLNLNPLSHIDPVGFFMLIFAHFGWGKPVEINPTNFNRKRSMSAQEAIDKGFADEIMSFEDYKAVAGVSNEIATEETFLKFKSDMREIENMKLEIAKEEILQGL